MSFLFQRMYDATYTKPIAAAKEIYSGTIDNAKTAIWSLEGQKHLFEAKKVSHCFYCACVVYNI